MVKGYFTLWVLLGLAAGVFFLTGNMTLGTIVVFGVISFGMVFMGKMGVLPIVVTEPAKHKPQRTEAARRQASSRNLVASVSGAVAAWFDPSSVEIRKPKYP